MNTTQTPAIAQLLTESLGKSYPMSMICDMADALQDKKSPITIYWDAQDPDNAGPAWRDDSGSGPLELLGWHGDNTGMHLADFFRQNGEYAGPDCDGVYPVLIPA